MLNIFRNFAVSSCVSHNRTRTTWWIFLAYLFMHYACPGWVFWRICVIIVTSIRPSFFHFISVAPLRASLLLSAFRFLLPVHHLSPHIRAVDASLCGSAFMLCSVASHSSCASLFYAFDALHKRLVPCWILLASRGGGLCVNIFRTVDATNTCSSM